MLDDLASQDEGAIRDRMLSVVAKLALLFLRVLPRCALDEAAAAIARWRELFDALLAHPDPAEVLGPLYYYLLAAVPAEPSELHAALTDVLPPATKDPIMNALEKLLRSSKEEGLEEGRAEAQIAVLLRLLEIRFGPTPEPVAARVKAGTEDERATWTERVLTAASLDQVFGE